MLVRCPFFGAHFLRFIVLIVRPFHLLVWNRATVNLDSRFRVQRVYTPQVGTVTREREIDRETSPRTTVARGPIINSRLIGFSVLIPGPIVIIPDGCNYRRGNIRLHVVESLRAAVHVITFPSFAGLN